MKKHIPNAITCANLFSGCIGIVFAFHQDLKSAAYFVLLSAVFDFFDGLFARWLNVKSDIGKELDSLADMVSFGFLPSVLMHQLLLISSPLIHPYMAYLGFLIAVFSALRLAKFNIDTRQTENFIGLNTPTNTLFIVSLIFIKDIYPSLISQSWILLGIIVLSCIGMVSEMPLFSLKLNKNGWYANRFKLIFVIISAVLIAFLKFVAVPIILVFYILLSNIHFKINK